MNNSPVKSELYVALEMVELTQFLPFTKTLNIVALNKKYDKELTIFLYQIYLLQRFLSYIVDVIETFCKFMIKDVIRLWLFN